MQLGHKEWALDMCRTAPPCRGKGADSEGPCLGLHPHCKCVRRAHHELAAHAQVEQLANDHLDARLAQHKDEDLQARREEASPMQPLTAAKRLQHGQPARLGAPAAGCAIHASPAQLAVQGASLFLQR